MFSFDVLIHINSYCRSPTSCVAINKGWFQGTIAPSSILSCPASWRSVLFACASLFSLWRRRRDTWNTSKCLWAVLQIPSSLLSLTDSLSVEHDTSLRVLFFRLPSLGYQRTRCYLETPRVTSLERRRFSHFLCLYASVYLFPSLSVDQMALRQMLSFFGHSTTRFCIELAWQYRTCNLDFCVSCQYAGTSIMCIDRFDRRRGWVLRLTPVLVGEAGCSRCFVK